jgi:dienelactone hydrolase
MKTKYFLLAGALIAALGGVVIMSGCGRAGSGIREEVVTYKDGGTTLLGYVAYNKKITGRRPAILVVPEWWGLNDYAKMRARKLADLGYVAMAVDVFGDGRIASDPQQAMAYTKPFYQDPELAKSRVEAGMYELSKIPQADPENVAAIGYCFGGYVVLNAAKLGSPLKGVVSFHGGIGGAPVDKNQLKAKLLICQGAADSIAPLPLTEAFAHQLDSIGADYTLKVYPNATHAFSNPASTEIGKKFNLPLTYNPAADSASWQDMQEFLSSLFQK